MFEFVSFKTAKLAAEKGIKGNANIDQYKFYQLNHYKYNENHYKDKPRKHEYGDHGYEDDIHAFTLYELKKRLREEFNIIVEVCITDTDVWYYDVFSINKKNGFNHLPTINVYDTYEEAMDAGLYVAINRLIKKTLKKEDVKQGDFFKLVETDKPSNYIAMEVMECWPEVMTVKLSKDRCMTEKYSKFEKVNPDECRHIYKSHYFEDNR